MGRDIWVYGLNYARMKERFAAALEQPENLARLEPYADEEGMDCRALLQTVRTAPEMLRLREIDVLISSFLDMHGLFGFRNDQGARDRAMAKLGITCLLTRGRSVRAAGHRGITSGASARVRFHRAREGMTSSCTSSSARPAASCPLCGR